MARDTAGIEPTLLLLALLAFSIGISFADENVRLDAAERHRVIAKAAQNLKLHYVDPTIAGLIVSS